MTLKSQSCTLVVMVRPSFCLLHLSFLHELSYGLGIFAFDIVRRLSLQKEC